jgi:hypothetical protein
MKYGQPMPVYAPPVEEQRTQIATMLVSLYLMLVCFFLVLASISYQDTTQSAGALKSVNKTFGTLDKLSILPTEGMSMIAPVQPIIHPGNVIAAIAEDIKVAMGDTSLQLLKTEKAIHFTIPLSEVYEPGRYELQLKMEKVFQTLKELLPAGKWNQMVSVTCMIGTPNFTQASPALLGMVEQLAYAAEVNWSYPQGSIPIGLTYAEIPVAILTFKKKH